MAEAQPVVVNRQWRKEFTMTGKTGSTLERFTIPEGMNFVTILNATNNTPQLYQEIVTIATADKMYSLVQTIPWFNQTVPLKRGNGVDFTFIYTDGGGTQDKTATLIFSTENLGINSTTPQPGTTTNTSIIGDAVGLARQNQLPSALSASGKLKVELNDGNAQSVMVTGQGPDLKVVPGSNALFRSKDTPNAITVGGTLPLTGTPTKVGNSLIVAVMLSADPANTVNVMYGIDAYQPMFLLPGQTVIVPASEVTLKAASGTASVGWAGIS